MATRSTIGYETPEGRYRATYCHYDGYPSHMKRELLDLTREDVEIMVTTGWIRGGIRTMSGARPEYFNDVGWDGARIDKERLTRVEEYAYMLTLDGKWVYLDYDVSDPQRLDEYAG
jgi:uncharacterized protein YchJ